jgi:hypothetical protein
MEEKVISPESPQHIGWRMDLLDTAEPQPFGQTAMKMHTYIPANRVKLGG